MMVRLVNVLSMLIVCEFCFGKMNVNFILFLIELIWMVCMNGVLMGFVCGLLCVVD